MSANSKIEYSLPQGRRLGVLKTAAQRIGVEFETYLERIAQGDRWCTACKDWHPRSAFTTDNSRGSGLSATCRPARRRRPRGRRIAEHEAARYAVNLAVRYRRLPRANAVPCVDCGHVWQVGERRHEYDHHAGYAAKHRLTVEAVCTTCHAQREKERRHG